MRKKRLNSEEPHRSRKAFEDMDKRNSKCCSQKTIDHNLKKEDKKIHTEDGKQ